MADVQTVNVRPPVWALIVAVIIGGFFYIGGKHIEAEDDPSDEGTISVSGDGRVFAVPDIAELSFGIQTGRQKTAAIAMERVSDGMKAVFDAVKAQGVEEKDIRTENFWLNPSYDWATGQQMLRGFEANQSLRVKVRDLDKVSAVLAAATNAGANQAGSVSFTVDEPEAKRAEARMEAIKEAKEKAEKLADELGVELGEIKSFSEGGGGYYPPVMMRAEAYGMGGGEDMAQKQTPLPAGEKEITVSVTIVYELE